MQCHHPITSEVSDVLGNGIWHSHIGHHKQPLCVILLYCLCLSPSPFPSLSLLLVVVAPSSDEYHAHAGLQILVAGISSYPCIAGITADESVNDKLFSTIMWQVSD
jgi:hypothetical protein